MKNQLQYLKAFLFYAAAATALIWIAFYNGFPFVYADTSTYIESGFTLEVPMDRPITYGLLVRLFSLNGFCVWGIPFFQALLLLVLMRWCIREFFSDEIQALRVWIGAVLILTVCSGLPLLVTQLIPDFFTPVLLLTIFLLLYGKKLNRVQNVFTGFALLVSAACHVSNVVIGIGLLVIVSISAFIRYRRKLIPLARTPRIIVAFVLMIVAWVSMASVLSKSRHVFMMGHLVETGILSAYLDDHCGKENISLCNYRDRIPSSAENFIWNLDGDSVLLKTGGWLGSKEEYSRIIAETFRDPKYLKMHLAAAVSGTIRQLYTIRVGEGLGRYDSAQMVSQRLRSYFPNDATAYSKSRQSLDEFASAPVVDLLNRIATSISLLIILAWMIVRRPLSPVKQMWDVLFAVLVLGYILNCAACAMFSTVINRYGARLSWMAILLACLLVAEWMRSRKISTEIRQTHC